jgi:dephospho-CoA kinase
MVMMRVALTGGIASGKTTVCGMLEEHGCQILDADKIAHELILPGNVCYQPVVESFGHDILEPDGRIDRFKLGARVFKNPAELTRLNAIIHPEVKGKILACLEAFSRQTPVPRLVVDASVLFESGFQRDFDFVIVVTCSARQQVERLQWRNGLTEQESQSRLAAQWPLEEKARRANFIIDNSGSLENTRYQVDLLLDQLGWKPLNPPLIT